MVALLVDDEKRLLNSLSNAVSQVPEITESAAFDDEIEALEFAKRNRVDVAFLDIKLHEMDGLTLAKELIAIHPQISIVFCTGYENILFIPTTAVPIMAAKPGCAVCSNCFLVHPLKFSLMLLKKTCATGLILNLPCSVPLISPTLLPKRIPYSWLFREIIRFYFPEVSPIRSRSCWAPAFHKGCL